MIRTRFIFLSGRPISACALLLIGTTVSTTLPARADMITTWNATATELLPKMKKQGPYILRGLAIMTPRCSTP
jgi:hypothetical protein